MLISVDELKREFGVSATGVLHVGAHLAEESEDYEKAGWSTESKVIWVESQIELAQLLIHTLNPLRNKVINATVWSETGKEMIFHVANNSQSSSLFDFGTHAETYPDINFTSKRKVMTVRLDEIINESDDISFVNLDVQGAELEALKGLGLKINNVKWIYSEVNKREVYAGCAKIEELDFFLKKYSFKRIATRWAFRTGWGDALWIKKSESRGMLKVVILFKINENLRIANLLLRLLKHKIKTLFGTAIKYFSS